jgi:hypothetical protein
MGDTRRLSRTTPDLRDRRAFVNLVRGCGGPRTAGRKRGPYRIETYTTL